MKKELIQIALPVTVQSLFQASMSVIDQVMTGQLGAVCVAGIGLGGKFSSFYTVILAAIATAAGILISQFAGSKDWEGVARNFWMCLLTAGGLAAVFSVISLGASRRVMGIYTQDLAVMETAARYLWIIGIGFLPMAATSILTALHRSLGFAGIPLYASLVSVIANTGLNYLLIFGKFGMPRMGLAGAAWATTIARLAEFLIVLYVTFYLVRKKKLVIKRFLGCTLSERKLFLSVVGPIFFCEGLWSLGENIYGVIYGRMGTDSCAAMTLTGPVQSLIIGAMTGIAAAAGIMTGKKLGEGKEEEAYAYGRKFMWYGFAGTAGIAAALLVGKRYYVQLFAVDESVKQMTIQILTAYALLAVVKVQNMILGGGVVRSGGKTKLILIIDVIGTWCFGIPLGLLCGFVWKLPIVWTYFILSQEECVRFLMTLFVFKKRIWMQNLTERESCERAREPLV